MPIKIHDSDSSDLKGAMMFINQHAASFIDKQNKRSTPLSGKNLRALNNFTTAFEGNAYILHIQLNDTKPNNNIVELMSIDDSEQISFFRLRTDDNFQIKSLRQISDIENLSTEAMEMAVDIGREEGLTPSSPSM